MIRHNSCILVLTGLMVLAGTQSTLADQYGPYSYSSPDGSFTSSVVFDSTSTTQAEAASICASLGMTLAAPQTEDYLKFVIASGLAVLGSDSRFWLGFTDVATEGQFVTPSGQPMNPAFAASPSSVGWCQNEPQSSSIEEDCTGVLIDSVRCVWPDGVTVGEMNDFPCDGRIQMRVACEQITGLEEYNCRSDGVYLVGSKQLASIKIGPPGTTVQERADLCRQACDNTEGCNGYVYKTDRTCILKAGVTGFTDEATYDKIVVACISI